MTRGGLATTERVENVVPAGGNTADLRTCNVLVFSSTFPSAVQPIHGVFVKERVRHVAGTPGCDVSVVSPVPYFPPLKPFRRWYPLSQIAREEIVDGLRVTRPRYLLAPKIGKYFHARSMELAARRSVARIVREREIDVIDAHFVYPDGIAAARLAQRLDMPLVITGRGEDVLTCPSDPALRTEIQKTLQAADELIAVSEEIATAMIRLGAASEKVTVIPNGVDTERFQPMDQDEARRRLQLPDEGPIVLSVGYRLERKGFHLLIEAAARLRGEYPSLRVMIVGGPARWGQDYSAEIEATIQRLGMADQVKLIGPRSQEELCWWYSAADLFALVSSREGCPNALMEALACGLPSVATHVGQIPQVLSDNRLGSVIDERTVEATAKALREGLSREWDRKWIRNYFQRHSWSQAAERIRDVFQRAIEGHSLKSNQGVKTSSRADTQI